MEARDLDNLSDSELFRHCGIGRLCGDRLVRKYKDMVFNFCKCLIGFHDRAEDACIDVFTAFIRRSGEYCWEKRDHNIRALLYSIARDRCTDEIRRIKKEKKLAEKLRRAEAEQRIDILTPLREAEKTDDIRRYMQVLSSAEKEDVLLILLRDTMTLENIGALFNITAQGAKYRVDKAYARIEEKLREDGFFS